MTVVYNEDVPSYAKVKLWADDLCRGRSLEGEAWSERPSKVVCKGNCHAVENIVYQNLQVNVQVIADTMGINARSVKLTLGKHCMTEVCVRSVPSVFDQNMKDY